MKSTGLKVKRPTAGSIRRFLALTNKRHLLLTGGRGAGKTTLLNALAADIPEAPGITTRAIPGRVVQMEDRSTGESFPIGVFDPARPGAQNRMSPIQENLEGPGATLLRACAQSKSGWAVLDEIGYLEASCPGYVRALNELLDQKRVLAAVRKQQIPFLQALLCREDACVIDLDGPCGNLGCIIMASGLGKRFGGNKLLADFNGQPMILCALNVTEGIFEKRVVVTRSQAVAQLCWERGVAVILHDLPDRSDTVRLGIDWMNGEVDGCVFCPCDQPLLTRESMELMALCADDEHILQLSADQEAGAPVLFPKWCFEQLKNLPQGKGGSAVIKKHPNQVRRVPAGKNELRDVDTPEDLEELRRECSWLKKKQKL